MHGGAPPRKLRTSIARAARLGVIVCFALGAGCASRPQGTVTDPATPPPRADETTTPRVQAPASERAVQVVRLARARLGAGYRWGGTGESGYDCSGLVLTVFAEVGVRLPRTTREQARAGRAVDPGEMRPGDLVFFGDGPRSITHVGIVSSSQGFIHSSQSRGVVEDPFDSRYFRRRFVGVRRVL